MNLKMVIEVLQVGVDIAKVVNDLIQIVRGHDTQEVRAELIGHLLELAGDVLAVAGDFFTCERANRATLASAAKIGTMVPLRKR